MLSLIISSFLAGLCITIGSAAYCAFPIGGILLFCAGLLTICYKQYSLFTGVVGYARSAQDWVKAGIILFGNLLGCLFTGFIISFASPTITAAATEIIKNKTIDFWQILLKAIMCGACMYLAVSLYKEKNSILGIFLFVPTFIVCGWEHSIALAAYYGISRILFGWQLPVVILGNAIGAKIVYELNELKGVKYYANIHPRGKHSHQ